MATRTSTRPRAVDPVKQLPIVRNTEEVDNWEIIDWGLNPDGNGPTATQPQPQANLPPFPGQVKKMKVKEIPVPEVRPVPTYTRDYLPTFKIPETYIRVSTAAQAQPVDVVEYDLDNEDEDWLATFNKVDRCAGRLCDVKFERMLWKLETTWGEIAESMMSPTERISAASLAPTTCLTKLQAMQVLRRAVGGQERILESVYDYWARKRKIWGKPIMRRLQAPTPAADTNPFNVFRVREKTNRPLTRRRRENSAECLEKLRQIRENILRALELAELMVLRERKKADAHLMDMMMQRCQLNLAHQPPALHEAVVADAQAALQAARARSAGADPRVAQYADAQAGMQLGVLDASVHAALVRKRKRQDQELVSFLAVQSKEVLEKLPPPVPMPDLEPLYVYQPNVLELCVPPDETTARGTPPAQPPLQLPPGLVAAVGAGTVQAYVGRNGRLILARVDPVTWEPHGAKQQPAQNGTGMWGQSLGMPAVLLPPQGLPGLGAAPENGVLPGAAAQPLNVSDASVFTFAPNEPEPWAATLDLSLLPDHIPRGPILAARQQWQLLHSLRESGLAAPGIGQAAVVEQPGGTPEASLNSLLIAIGGGSAPSGIKGFRSRLQRVLSPPRGTQAGGVRPPSPSSVAALALTEKAMAAARAAAGAAGHHGLHAMTSQPAYVTSSLKRKA